MDMSWIQIFVLTLAECVAPAGKTVCQEQQFELEFLTRGDCEVALEQLVSLKDESAAVIVNRDKSSCAASARRSETFSSATAVSNASQDDGAWKEPSEAHDVPIQVNESHQQRLASLPECEGANGVLPCKLDGIIVEAEVGGEPVEVWRRDR